MDAPVTTDPWTRSDSVQSQVAKHIDEIRRPTPTPYEDTLTFWASRRPSYDLGRRLNCRTGITGVCGKNFLPVGLLTARR